MNVFLDDIREAPKGFQVVRNVKECIELLKTNKIKVLSLDHDLGENEKTGYNLTKYMVEHNLYAEKIFLHTSNPVGRSNMYQLLMRYKPESVKIYPYPSNL